MAARQLGPSVVIPAFNAEPTLHAVLAALKAQSLAPQEFVLVDDASTDKTAEAAAAAGLRVVRLSLNLGRGGARCEAMKATKSDIVMMCDSTLAPNRDFLERIVEWMGDSRVGAVFGRVASGPVVTVADRWRARHLFRSEEELTCNDRALLATSVCGLRRQAVAAVGGFDERLRAGEDADLGRRLLQGGWKVVFDPRLVATCLTHDTTSGVLRRFARWNSPSGLGWRNLPRQLHYAMKVMMARDLRACDPLCALLSFLSPFYQLRRS